MVGRKIHHDAGCHSLFVKCMFAEDKLLAFSRDRGEGVLATLVEDFVGSECPEN